MEQVNASQADRRPLLLGRDREQALLRHALETMLAGHGALVLVSGEAGIGKTTLVEDLAIQAERAGVLVLWGHAYDLSVTPPFGPWVELARSYTPSDDLPPFPAFLHGGEALAAVGSQDALFAQTWDFFATVAAHQPLVLILEDLHWADAESLALLRFVARQLARHRVLLLATYRSDDLTRRHSLYELLPLLVREAGAVRLAVPPLDQDAQRALIAEQYALASADAARLASYLAAHAEGNPLYAGELLRTLAEDRVLVGHDGAWVLGDLGHVRVPPLLLQVIEGRLARLSEETRTLLQIAAVIGQEVPLILWKRVSGATDEALAVTIEQGQAASLIAEVADGTHYRFQHALIREALYAAMVLPRRQAWHRRTAETLAAEPRPEPDTVAYHLTAAGDQRAGEWLMRAGERAESAFALITAAARFEAALARADQSAFSPVERAVLLFRTARALRYANPDKALALTDEAHRLALAMGEVWLAGFCRYFTGLLRCFLGDIGPGLALMEQAIAEVPELRDPDWAERHQLPGQGDLWRLDGALEIWLANAGRFGEVLARADQAPDRARPSGLEQALGLTLALRGAPLAARQAFERARAGFEAIGQYGMVWNMCRHEIELVAVPYFTDDIPYRTRLVRQDAVSGQLGNGALGLSTRLGILALMVLEGTWHGAREAAEQVYRSRLWQMRLHGGRWLALVASAQGDTTLTQHVIADILPNGPRAEPGSMFHWVALPLQLLSAELSLGERDLPTARAWLEAHDRWLDWSGAVLGRAEGALVWACYHHANGDRALARQHAEQAVAHASDPRQPLALLAVHRFLGQLDTEARQFDTAEQHLRASLALSEACAAPFERALTLLELARLRQAQANPEEARAVLSEVRAICEPLNAKPTLQRVEALEQQLAGRPRSRRNPERDRYPARLTAREVEVLRLVAQGLTDPEVAERLYLSRRTIGSHLAAIYNKLGVNTRAAATRFAVEHDLV